MSPKKTIFTRGAVLQAALDVVRQHGWGALAARSVAERLGASVAPVYSAFGSMESLLRETLKETRRLLQEYTSRASSELPFLNIGAGVVSFARDEPLLYQALFQVRHRFQDVVEGVNASILSWMKSNVQLGLLTDAARERLYDNIGFYTMGLAAAVAAGRVADVSTDNIVRLLKNMGNIVMFAEVSGIAESESPASKREWMRIMKEKNIPFPESQSKIKATASTVKHSRASGKTEGHPADSGGAKQFSSG